MPEPLPEPTPTAPLPRAAMSPQLAAPRAVVVGEVSLAARCALVLAARGLDTVIVADHPDVVAAAHEGGVRSEAFAALADVLAERRALLLVSAGNLRILPASVLAAADRAVNFHDGPLPELAGRNVTTWAIADGAAEHGVSWHELTTVVDGGGVLVAERFPIGADETAFELNARCFEIALRTFPQVLDLVLAGSPALPGVPPQRQCRSTDRLGERALLAASSSAPDMARLVRALDLGGFAPNPVGRVRWLLPDGRVVVVAGAHVRASSAEAAPGTVLDVRAEGFDVALADGVLAIERLEDPSGTAVGTADLGLVPGEVLPVAPADVRAAFAEAERRGAVAEARWLARMERLDTVAAPQDTERTWGAGGRVDGITDTADAAALAALWTRWQRPHDRPAVLLAGAPPAVGRVDPFVVADCAGATVPAARAALAAAARSALDDGPWLADLVGRVPARRGTDLLAGAAAVVADRFDAARPGVLQLVRRDGGLDVHMAGCTAEGARRVSAQLRRLLDAPPVPLAELDRTPEDNAAVAALCGPAVPVPEAASVWADIRDALARRAADVVVRSDAHVRTGTALIDEVERRASALRTLGIGPGDRVGIALDRDLDLVVSLLAVLASGAAYVPIDPAYPAARRRLVLDDADLRLLLVSPDHEPPRVDCEVRTPGQLDDVRSGDGAAAAPSAMGDLRAEPAYLIYTSGSTGAPKAVVVEHRNVLNLFAGLDELVTAPPGSVWLAATSLSFDISVLELLWTLHAGVTVVVAPSLRPTGSLEAQPAVAWPSLSLYFFAAAGGAPAGAEHGLYDFLLESAVRADRAGLEAVWMPERHFHEFGGPYANPSVLAAAVAARTSRLIVRAGSVVAALHHPARIAEEWAMVDRLSGGRVGVSLASGWMPRDGVLHTAGRVIGKEGMVSTLDEVRRLWRGETVRYRTPAGDEYDVSTLPRPIQPELPMWLTSAGSADTFELAGRLGANMLTHLLGQDVAHLARNIEIYRRAWSDAGHPGHGQVTLMLHTYLGDDAAEVRRLVHQPMKDYLRSAVGLVGALATSFPTFSSVGHDADLLFAELDAEQVETLLDAAATRYELTAGLFGTEDDALAVLRRVAEAGVDEVACLVDFGVEHELALAGIDRITALHHRIDTIRHETEGTAAARVDGFAALVAEHGVTHFQCTPSQATVLLSDPADRAALASLRHLLVGGEALPVPLADELCRAVGGRVTNVYGPTETTVWSLAAPVGPSPVTDVTIGRALANQRLDVVDGDLRPVPVGARGELLLGGAGVAREYRGRPDLTAERFVVRGVEGERWYRTGDEVLVTPDGVLRFLGRSDGQVKIAGHRIELGDIETALRAQPGVREAAVVVDGTGASSRLVAWVVADPGTAVELLRDAVAAVLPAIMVPSTIRRTERLPRTPNGKVDRRAVASLAAAAPAPGTATTRAEGPGASGVDAIVAGAWQEVLGALPDLDAPFFAVGGNSLLAVRLFRLLEPASAGRFQLTDVFRYPTLRSMTAHLRTLVAGALAAEPAAAPGASPLPAASAADDRAARRRAARGR